MTAVADAFAFLAIMMVAIAVTAMISYDVTGSENDPDDFLTALSMTEVRMSDLTDIDDDTLVYITDLMAYDLVADTGVGDYLNRILAGMFGHHRYHLAYSDGTYTEEVGEDIGFARSESSRVFRLSTGDSLYVLLSIQ